MAQDKEQLRKTYTEALNALREIENAEQRVLDAKLVGKHFKFRNSYSLPGPGDYWWVYFRADSLGDYGFTGLEFQTDKDGEVTMRPDKWNQSSLSGYVPCTKREFDRAWVKVQARIAALK